MNSSAFDVVVVGGGPAGAMCAAACAQAGLRVLVLEKSTFPRDKVCGDCVNPACWPLLDQLQLGERVRALPHASLEAVEFVGLRGSSLTVALPSAPAGEIAVRRSALDQLLLTHAAECGATVLEETSVVSVVRDRLEVDATPGAARKPVSGQRLSNELRCNEKWPHRESPQTPGTSEGAWSIRTTRETFRSRYLVAADGRNSTIARSLGLLPAVNRERVGLQTHLPLPAGVAGRVVMRFLPRGYCGLADIGDGQANLCLVCRPSDLPEVKAWAMRHFCLDETQLWRSITPLRRASLHPQHGNLLLVGDAARVVEPFTGEGIYYALASGELAARHLIADEPGGYARTHAQLYRGRLWVNQLARFACLHPSAATVLLQLARVVPAVLGLLTRKVVSISQPAPRAVTPARGGAAWG